MLGSLVRLSKGFGTISHASPLAGCLSCRFLASDSMVHSGVHNVKHSPVDKCGLVHLTLRGIVRLIMDTKDAGRLGAIITNKKLTTEGRRKAAKKGWKLRKEKLALLK